MELFQVKTLNEIYEILDKIYLKKESKCEQVSYSDSVGRILAEDIKSTENIPGFKRSTVDGYSVLASDTIGASESIPVLLSYKGEVLMGEACEIDIKKGETIYVPTGGHIPESADAMVMIEHTEVFSDEIAINKAVRVKENIMDKGDDVFEGQVVLRKGTQIKPQHIAVFSALGIVNIKVYNKPIVSIFSTGDELISPGEELIGSKIRDVNGPTLRALVEEIGCVIKRIEIIHDDEYVIYKALEEAVLDSDIVLVSGGSSVGKQDNTPEIINRLGSPGVLAHGISMKPGKPTIVGYVRDCAVFGLPGQPTSCIVSYLLVVQRLIKKHLLKQKELTYKVDVKANFQMNSSSGRTEIVLVKIKREENEYIAEMIPGKSGMVTTLSEAVGFIEVPMEKGGIVVGEKLQVELLQPVTIGEYEGGELNNEK